MFMFVLDIWNEKRVTDSRKTLGNPISVLLYVDIYIASIVIHLHICITQYWIASIIVKKYRHIVWWMSVSSCSLTNCVRMAPWLDTPRLHMTKKRALCIIFTKHLSSLNNGHTQENISVVPILFIQIRTVSDQGSRKGFPGPYQHLAVVWYDTLCSTAIYYSGHTQGSNPLAPTVMTRI